MTGVATTIEVFADITCPFTHVGLKVVTSNLVERSLDVEVHVRAWPLEWVNGKALDVDATAKKVAALREQLGESYFADFRIDRWPETTLPALNLAAAAYERGPSVGLTVSLALRDKLFENGSDAADSSVLTEIAKEHGVPLPFSTNNESVRLDYSEGRRRGVVGSPHYWIGADSFFCPSLDIGHDALDGLTARIDVEGLERFMAKLPDR